MQATDVKTIYAAGTAYQLTNATAALDFGTTDPSLTLGLPGTWLLMSRVNLKYTAATFAAVRTVTITLNRSNNTAAAITGATSTFLTDIITTLTYTAGIVMLPSVLYTTENNNDIIRLQGLIDTVPSAGSMDVTAAEIVAIRLY